jgi:hypothetical protein
MEAIDLEDDYPEFSNLNFLNRFTVKSIILICFLLWLPISLN